MNTDDIDGIKMTPEERGQLEKYLDMEDNERKKLLHLLGINEGEQFIRGYMEGELTALLFYVLRKHVKRLTKADIDEIEEMINKRIKDYLFK